MRPFRSIIFWCHLAAGVFAGVVVLIMSATGVLLTYQRQITVWADMRTVEAAPPSAGAQRLPPAALVERVLRTEQGKPTALTWRAGRDAPVQVAFGRERTVFASAYTGEVLGEGGKGVRAFFRKVTDIHRWLGAGEENRALGKMVTGACNLAFLFLVVSGFYLWWPDAWSRRMLRNITWFRRGLRPKARDFNWHNTIGFWSAVPLFVVVLSGVVISYQWAGSLVYRAAGEAPPPPAEGGGRPGAPGLPPAAALAGVDALWPRVTQRVPGWRIITLNLPRKPDAPFVFSIDRGNGGEPHKRAQLTLERATGREVKWEPFAASSPGRRMRSILRFARTPASSSASRARPWPASCRSAPPCWCGPACRSACAGSAPGAPGGVRTPWRRGSARRRERPEPPRAPAAGMHLADCKPLSQRLTRKGAMLDMQRWVAAGAVAMLAACSGGDHEYDPDNDAEATRTANSASRQPSAAQPGSTADTAAAGAGTVLSPDSLRAAFARGRPLGASEIGWLRRDVNRTQVATAQSLGVRAYADAQIRQLVRQGRLVALGDSTPHWVLRKMDHSVPYVTPDARALLVQVGRRFHARLDSLGIPRYRMKVTSALRTGSTQSELRKINSYASQTASAHEFGTTMDVSHERFAVPTGAGIRTDTLEELGKEHAKVLQGELGRTLIELRARELLHVMIEDRQPVYHFTVRQRLAATSASK